MLLVPAKYQCSCQGKEEEAHVAGIGGKIYRSYITSMKTVCNRRNYIATKSSTLLKE